MGFWMRTRGKNQDATALPNQRAYELRRDAPSPSVSPAVNEGRGNPRAIVERQFMKMSKAHDRIRSICLAAHSHQHR